MQTFKDAKGRTWTLAVNVAAVKRVKSLCGVDLTEIDQGSPPLAIRLSTDVILLCDVLYSLVKLDADAISPPVTDEDFGGALGGDALRNASDALGEELTDFFQKWGRPEFAAVLRSQKTLFQKATARSFSKLDDLSLDALLTHSENERLANDPQARAAEELLSKCRRQPGNESIGLPASSA